MKTFDPGTIRRWRQWLARHHDSESEIWVVFHKSSSRTERGTASPRASSRAERGIGSLVNPKPSGPSVRDAVEEALCFGWVDSLVKRIDERRYAVKFTPRRPNSRWSAINRKRYAELAAAGRLKPAGVARPPTDRTYDAKPRMPATLPRYIQLALRREPPAWQHFQELTHSERRRYAGWVHSAKKDETKRRRLEEVVRTLTAGRKLGLK